MKFSIIQLFRKNPQGIKTETACFRLKITPEAFESHIECLKTSGYIFARSDQGIQLVSSPDVPYAWEFPEYEPDFHYFQNVQSTMINARELAEKGAPHFSIVFAEHQDRGRGRLDRKWISSDGGLYFTIILRPKVSPSLCYRVNFIASLVLAETLRNLYEIDALVKWPNDILVNEKKVSGMLSEMALAENHTDYVNLGIGINVNNDPTKEEPKASSVRLILGKSVSRTELLRSFLSTFEKKVSRIALEKDIISQWKKVSLTIGRKVTVATTQSTFSGIAVDVDDQGALVLEKADGSKETVIYGDCFLDEGH